MTYKKAKEYYDQTLEKNKKIFFEVQTENGRQVNYEIGLIEKHSKKEIPLFKTDPLGRNIKVKSDDEDLTIIKLDYYKIPEKIFHINSKKKIDSELFIPKFLKGTDLKMISKLNNKIIVQNEDNYDLFSLKSSGDANRFLDELQLNLIYTKKLNCLIVKDSDMAQKKYLYKILEEKGFNKKMLYRTTTTHLKDK